MVEAEAYPVADRIDRLLSDLEASFEGSVARDESLVASDLALSLRQDVRIFDRISSWGGAHLMSGTPETIAAVARDYLVVGDPATSLVPFAAAVLVPASRADSIPVRRSDDTLMTALKPWVRAGRRVRVLTPDERVEGRLLAATPDHILIAQRTEVLIPYDSVRRVSLCPED